MKRSTYLAIVMSLSCAVFLTPAPARAGKPGSIVVTDHAIDTTSSDFEKDLKASAKTALSQNKDDGGWHLYYVAFLSRPPGSDEAFIVFYDTASPKHETVNNYPLHTKANAKIIQSDILVKTDDGFKAGHKYNVMITRLINGREEVYARTTIGLN